MKKVILICGILFFVGYLTTAYVKTVRFYSAVENSELMKPYVQKLADTLNRQSFFHTLLNYKTVFTPTQCSEIKILAANWEDNEAPINGENETCTVLWAGSRQATIIPNIHKFMKVWVSSPLLANFLKTSHIETTYVPLFSEAEPLENIHKKLFGIVGNPLYITEVLHKNNLPYRKFKSLSDLEHHANNLFAVFVDGGNLAKTTLDVHPVYMNLMYNNIPLVQRWIWPQESFLNRFNDTIHTYDDKKGAEVLIGKILTNTSEIQKKSAKAKTLIIDEYSLERSAERAWSSFYPKVPSVNAKIKKINIDIPTAVGHYVAGDYALAKDLESELEDEDTAVNLTFYNSSFKYPADVNLFIRGFIPVDEYNLTAPLNALYLAYAQFGQDETHEFVMSHESYIGKLFVDTENVKVLLIASKILAETLTDYGRKAYYIPQFTNTDRFYYDYTESLKSDVLFVGANTFYRRAVPTLLKHQIPVTVYGPDWAQGIASAPYADNRILRKYYSSAKIVLNDTRDGMKKFGFISNRIYDATACGTLVITDYMPEIEEIYGDSVPMWKTEEELVELVNYYLMHPKERQEKAQRAQAITLQNFTAKHITRQIRQILEENF